MFKSDILPEINIILENLCNFDYKRKITRKKQFVKIGCTIGPKCNNIEIMTKMLRAGMNIIRFNMSHSTHEECALNIQKLHEAIKKKIIEQ